MKNLEGVAVDVRYTYEGWAEVFTIFARYCANSQVRCEHDQIWAGPDPGEVSELDRARLEQLGWTASSEGGFTRYV